MNKPRLLISESVGFSKKALEILSECLKFELANLGRAQLIDQVSSCDYLWVRLRNRIDSEIMDAAPNLAAIVTNTTGLNHIDLDEAKRRGISVLSLKGEVEFLGQIRATAEHAIALTLCLLRRIPSAHQHVCAGGWDRDLFQGSEIQGKTVGIIGYGRLGKIVAKYFDAFGAKVLIHSRELMAGATVDSFRVVEFDSLLRDADIVSLHVNFEPENESMIGTEQFALMKPNSVLINTARGEIIDEKALIEALENNVIAGAALDVVNDEQVRSKPSLVRHLSIARNSDRLLITPHIGGNTRESTELTEVFMAKKLCRFIQ